MSNKKKAKLKEPWRKIHGAIWLLGIAILAWQNWWWPGILVLIALSSILEAILMQKVPEAFESLDDQETAAKPEVSQPTEPSPDPVQFRRDLLPTECPKCGAPLRPHAVQWQTPNAAHCPYCGVLLPLRPETS